MAKVIIFHKNSYKEKSFYPFLKIIREIHIFCRDFPTKEYGKAFCTPGRKS